MSISCPLHLLQSYFEYLHSWILMLQRLPQASVSLKNILDDEWDFSKEICPHVRGGEAQAGKRFWWVTNSSRGNLTLFLWFL